MEQKTENKFFIFQTIAFEFGMTILTITEKILVIWTQCVNKQPQDFTYYEQRHFQTQFSPE